MQSKVRGHRLYLSSLERLPGGGGLEGLVEMLEGQVPEGYQSQEGS